MSWDYIIAGDYGQVGKLTFIDVDTNAAANISSYTTTIQMLFTSPTGVTTTKTATFDSDGTDGVIKYTLTNTDITVGGNWKVRGRVAGAASRLTTEEHSFLVLE